MVTNRHRLVYNDAINMGGALRLVFAVRPRPDDRDWFACFESHLGAAGLGNAEVLDDGTVTALTINVNPLDATGTIDALADALQATDGEFLERILPARQAAEAEERRRQDQVTAAIAALDRRLRERFPA